MSSILLDKDAVANCVAAFEGAGVVDLKCARVGRVMSRYRLIALSIAHTLLAEYEKHKGSDEAAKLDWPAMVAWSITDGSYALGVIVGMTAAFDRERADGYAAEVSALAGFELTEVSLNACREAFAAAGQQDKRCRRIAEGMARHPRVARMVAHLALERYEEANGAFASPEAIDWTKVVDWLITYGPKILQILLMLLVIF